MNTSIKLGISLGKVLYGSLFVLVIPMLFVVWAYYTSSVINLPVPSNAVIISLMMITGAGFVVIGMSNLWFYGKGLPMNAFPPEKFVTKGVYAIAKNPIYLGTIILSFGISAFLHSSSGFWLVSPLFTLMILAYTIGFENERTRNVFGDQAFRPFLSLPEDKNQKLTIKDRFAVYFIAYLPWLIIYETYIFIGVPNDAVPTNLAFEKHLPVIEFSTIFYVSTYLFAALVPWILKSKKDLRNFATDILLSTGISAILYFLLPFFVKQTEFVPQTFWGRLLLFDRAMDGESAAFPAFHVIWAFLSARYFAVGINKMRTVWYVIAVLIAISCITTGCHSVLDVVAGLLVFFAVYNHRKIWNFIRNISERIANSWTEWRIGPIRFINHGLYAGAAGFVGIIIVGSFLGPQYVAAGFITGVLGIVGAAMWAQFIEGSPKLQRPYGYYGCVVGVVIGCGLGIIIFPVRFEVLMASYALAAPWIQILGRLRCLVQGCCHGKTTNSNLGLRFTHPLSRVNKISALQGCSLHPTQLYSIGSNFLSGIILIRLMQLNMSATLLIGVYLILNGLGRFVEEYFRGETQTPYWMGMRIYQWIAVLNILAGAISTAIPSVHFLSFDFNIESLYWALGMGIFASAAYGMDFPDSKRRFARLTS